MRTQFQDTRTKPRTNSANRYIFPLFVYIFPLFVQNAAIANETKEAISNTLKAIRKTSIMQNVTKTTSNLVHIPTYVSTPVTIMGAIAIKKKLETKDLMYSNVGDVKIEPNISYDLKGKEVKGTVGVSWDF